MKLLCPKDSCQSSSSLIKDGHYFRKNDSKFIQRYRCKLCGTRLSSARLSPAFRQKKRTINKTVAGLLCSKVSQRRIAKLLGIDKKTVHRKLVFLGREAKKHNQEFRRRLQKKVHYMQLDDLITKEISKLKPVTITVSVNADTRQILSLQAAQIPAFGHLAHISRAKYGKRESHHRFALQKVFEDIEHLVDKKALIRSDKHHLYPEFVKRFFPKADYETYKSERATISGQGELKKKLRDPIYNINHVHAMLRDNINRLVRRSWCVTQSIPMLQYHLELFMKFYNSKLI